MTDSDDLPPGSMIRRFVVLERIGAGAMGVVYSAFDYTLDRKVAIKLVRADDQMSREAPALARLSHPNVVAIYDVGTLGDRMFIAMEYIDGGTLRHWLEKPRSTDAILTTLLDAGRGLAAAHAAGIAHGDFKPENILVDKTGRCVVADFGLAGHVGASEARGGSPVYMAPEAHDGPPTPASDQFSFCVTLWEALHGERPFKGAIAAGQVREPSRRRVKPKIHKALLRGLSLRPEERWSSMTELLDAIARSNRRPNRIVLVAALTAAAGLGIGMVAVRGDHEPSCDGGDERVAHVWTDARRAALRGRIAPATFERASRRLDSYTREWSAMHRETCRATHVSGTQSPAVLDLRMECLRRRLVEIDADLDAIAGATDKIDTRVLDAIGALTPLAHCEDVTALQAATPLPIDPAGRTRVTALTAEHAKVKALYDVGRDREGLAAARVLGDAATALGYRPVEADALQLLGRLQFQTGAIDEAETTLLRAIAAAQAGNVRRVLARSWLELIWVVGEMRGRYEEAEKLGIIARGAVEEAGNPSDLVATLDDRLGVIAYDRGDFVVARTRLEAALALREHDHDELEIVASLQHLALLRTRQDDAAGALAMQRRATQIVKRELGVDHAVTGQVLNGYAAALYQQGDLDGAIAAWREALAIAERTHGPSSYDAAAVRASLALGLRDRGAYAEAIEQSSRGLADFLAVYGDDHPDAPGYLMNHGYVLLAAKRYADAEAQMVRAVAIVERRNGADAALVAQPLIALGRVRAAAGDTKGAALVLERALRVRELGKVSADELASVRIELAELLWRGGLDRARARVLAATVRETASGKLRARADALIAAK